MTLTPYEKVRPHLKIGARLVTHSTSTFVGRNDQGLEVISPARSTLADMDGTRTCEELSQLRGVPLSEITLLTQELDDAGLLDTEKQMISVHTRFHSPNANRSSHKSDDSNDGAVLQLKARRAPELSSTTWLPQVRDGGVAAISRRRDWQISIYGDSRIATLAFGLLLSSGVSRTSLLSADKERRVEDVDMCAGFLRPSDIGLPYKTRMQELSRELSLFPSAKVIGVIPREEKRMALAIGNVPADQVQEWMSEGVPHLFIEAPDGARIVIGPLVIPGRSPCSRCVSMSMEDQDSTWREIAMEKLVKPTSEVPVALAHHVAGCATLEILHFIDQGQSELIGKRIGIDYHRPTISAPQSFTRHPACGCNW